MDQLHRSITAVFKSWYSDRATKYREVQRIRYITATTLHEIEMMRTNQIRCQYEYFSGLIGTAVNVQAMVYGNYSANSGTGVLFSRNPANGENKLYGEYLIDAQGEL